MKNIKYMILLLVAVLILPLSVLAEEEKNDNSESKEVKIYLFRGEGCPHCQEAEEWFKSIEEEYGDKFEVIDYEVWYDDENNKLMEKVADARGEEASGVPYIIIGNKTWNGFAESYEEEMINEIKSEYEKDVSKRYDVMKYVKSGKTKKKDTTGSDVISLVVILALIGGLGFGIYKTRENVK